jgi:hypothetical protein
VVPAGRDVVLVVGTGPVAVQVLAEEAGRVARSVQERRDSAGVAERRKAAVRGRFRYTPVEWEY